MNFALSGMTFLRYYLPLIIEGNRRGITSNVFVGQSGKYNCPRRNLELLHNMSNQHGFKMLDMPEISKCDGPIFLIEGDNLDLVEHRNNKKICLTYVTDFLHMYEKYIERTDHVVFPSQFVAEYYNKLSDKNLYLGTSKYDFLEKDRSKILSRYNLPDEKYVLVVFPRNRDLAKIDLQKIYGFLRSMGYKILVKTRGKDPVSDPNNRGDYYYMDYSWYPHDTMELIEISDFIINFGSTTVKESVILKTPLIDFDIKPDTVIRGYDFLYEYDYCRVLKPTVTLEDFKQATEDIMNTDSDIYDSVLQKHLFVGNSSERILDFIS